MLAGLKQQVLLADFTTLRLGGPAAYFLEVRDEAALRQGLGWAKQRGVPAWILGGGSNLVVGDAGVNGLVMRLATRGRRYERLADGAWLVTAQAGEVWDDVVADTVARDFAGLACLSGIPGTVGATPIQNRRGLRTSGGGHPSGCAGARPGER